MSLTPIVFAFTFTLVKSLDLNIGILYEASRTTELTAIALSVEYANKYLLANSNITIKPLRFTVEDDLSAAFWIQAACALLDEGVVAVVGPATSTNVKLVASYLATYGVPLIAPIATSPRLNILDFVLKLAPSDVDQGSALADIMFRFNWTQVNLLSSADEYGTQGRISFSKAASTFKWFLATTQQFTAMNSSVKVQQQLQSIWKSGCRVTILICNARYARQILDQAKQLQMADAGWIWLVTDAVTSSDNFYDYSKAPPQHLQGMVGTSLYVTNAMHNSVEWDKIQALSIYGRYAADAVTVIAAALLTLGSVSVSQRLTCATTTTEIWSSGRMFYNALLAVDTNGFTGPLRFTSNAYPASTQYAVKNLREAGWMQVGTWAPGTRYVKDNMLNREILFPGNRLTAADFVSPINGAHLRITTIRERPFVVYPEKEGVEIYPKNLSDIQPNEIDGYAIETIRYLASVLNFTYNIYYVPDDKFGAKNITDGTWSGMAKEVVEKRADLVGSSFTVNRPRLTDFDFTAAYVDTGMRFVMKKQISEASMFQFLNPFTQMLWIALMGTLFVVAAGIACLDKLSPYGFHGKFVQDYHDMPRIARTKKRRLAFRRAKVEALNNMSFMNSLFNAWASLLEQGSTEEPQALSSRELEQSLKLSPVKKEPPKGRTFIARLIAVTWYMGVVVLISAYTAQLGAFLILSRLVGTINSIEDLYAQDKITYGTVAKSAPSDYFLDSKVETYKNMWAKMVKWVDSKEGLVDTVEDGYKRALDGKFAFIWDSAIFEGVIIKKPYCNLRLVGSLFGNIVYGFGLQKNSPYNRILSIHLLQLREQGYFDQMYKKWYTDQGNCPVDDASSTSNRMGVLNFQGVFYIIFGCLIISPTLLIYEWIEACIKVAYAKRKGRGFKQFLADVFSVFKYRVERMKRDFLIYYIPERSKESLGLAKYSRKVQREERNQQLKAYRNRQAMEQELESQFLEEIDYMNQIEQQLQAGGRTSRYSVSYDPHYISTRIFEDRLDTFNDSAVVTPSYDSVVQVHHQPRHRNLPHAHTSPTLFKECITKIQS